MMRSSRFIPEKLVDAVDYLLRQVGPCTRMKLVKLLYFADRYHLARHGTTVLGDRYYRLPWGPVPSRSLDVLEAAADVAAKDPEAPADDLSQRLLARIEVTEPESKYARYISKGLSVQPDRLSRSEIEALDAVAKRYGGCSPADLSRLTHTHQAFLKTDPQEEIDYRLFFLDEPGVKPEAVEYLEVSEQDHDLLARL
jgi:uncharacterized phage-associated protein